MIPDASALIAQAVEAAQAKNFRRAAEVGRLLTALDPRLAEGWMLYGAALGQLGETSLGRRALDEALRLAPGFPAAHWNRSFLNLAEGRWAEGWEDYEWGRVNGMRPVRTPRPQWDGQPTRELLVWTEQGAGDILQFSRWVPGLVHQSRAQEVIFECPLPLVRLFNAQPWPRVTVRALLEQGGIGDESIPHVALLSLPYTLSLTAADIRPCAYLSGPPAVHSKPDACLRVGLCWQGNPKHDNDVRRSLPVDVATRLTGLLSESVEWETWQPGLPPLLGTADRSVPGDDWWDTAAWLRGLDLLVSVDTGTAHLAGALGVPTCLLLPPVPDWRWGTEGDTTRWYESLLVQRCEEEWVDLLPKVEMLLRSLIERRKETLGAVA